MVSGLDHSGFFCLPFSIFFNIFSPVPYRMLIFVLCREPTSQGMYSIASTIYDGLATTITVGLSSTPPLNNTSSSSSTKGPITAVDDFVRFPLTTLTSRASLLGVSTSSPSNSTTSHFSSHYGTPAAASTTTSSSSFSRGGAAFRLPRAELSHDNTTPSSVSDVSLRSRAHRFEEDNEECDFEELAVHPSRPGLIQRRGVSVSVGTDTSDHRAEQQQQWHQVVSSRRAASTGTGNGTAVQRPPRRQQLAGLSQPFRGIPDIDERSPSPIQPCSPLAGPHTGSKYGGSSSNNSNSGGGGGDKFLTTYTTRTGAAQYCNEQPVKILDISRQNGGVSTNGGLYSKNGVSSSVSGDGAGAVGNNNANNNGEPTFPRCPRCQKDYACLSNQQRCMASHSKRGKQARHPAIASTDQLISFWEGLNKEERFDIIDYSSIPEATNAFYVLYAGFEKSKSSSALYSIAADPASQLENAGKELTKTLKASDKISEVSGEKFLKVLQDAAEGTLLLGSANRGSRDDSSHSAISPLPAASSSSSSPSSFLESTVFLGSVLGARLITALKAEQKRKSELAYWELEAALMAEEQEAEEQKKKKKKKTKKKNKKKGSTEASKTTSTAGDDASTELEEEENVVAAVNVELEGQEEEEEKKKKVRNISVFLLQRPVFDSSCLAETEVAVKKSNKLDEDSEVLQNAGTIPVEDSVDGLVDAAEIIIDTDGLDEEKEEEEEEGKIEVVARSVDDDAASDKQVVVLVSKEADSDSFIVDFGDDNEPREQLVEEHGAVKDAAVVVKKIERKGKAKKVDATTEAPSTVPDAFPVVLGSEQQPQPQQLTKAQRRRLSAKRKKEQAELVPGEAPRAVVLSTFNGTNTLTRLHAAVEQPPVSPPPPMQQQQQGKPTLDKKNQHQQQQANPESVIKKQSTLVPEVSVAPKAVVAVKEDKKEAKDGSFPTIAATATPAKPALVPAAAAMPAYFDGYGGPGYQHTGYYPPLIAPYNPVFAHHVYPTHLQHPLPIGADDFAPEAGVGPVLPLPPLGVSAAPYSPYSPYMMPPPHPHTGMMQQLPVHSMGVPVRRTPAAAGGSSGTDGRIAAPPSPLPDGVALGVPVDYEQQPAPQRLKEQQEQQQKHKEGPVEAAAEKEEEGHDKDKNRFKEMMWEAQLRSVHGDIALLRRLTAQLHKKAAGKVSSGPGKVSTERAAFDGEAAERYFERRSREIIEANTNTVIAIEAKSIVVAPPQPPPPAPAKTLPFGFSDADGAFDRPKPKKKVRGPRHKSTAPSSISGALNGVEATAMASNNTVSNTGFEAHRAPHPDHPPAAATAAGGGGDGGGSSNNGNIVRCSSSFYNASKNCSNGYTVNGNRRRNNNNNSNAAIAPVHADQHPEEVSSVQRQQQQRQQPRSFLAAAAGGPSRFPKLEVCLKSNSNRNTNTNRNGSRPRTVHVPQETASAEWKIQAHA